MRRLALGLWLVLALLVFASCFYAIGTTASDEPTAPPTTITEIVPTPTTTYTPPMATEPYVPPTNSSPLPDVIPNVDGPNVSCRRIFHCGVNW